jgi:hypothetical protein
VWSLVVIIIHALGIHKEEVVIATTTRHEFRKSLQEQLTRREEDS